MKNFGSLFKAVLVCCFLMAPPVAGSQAVSGYADGQRFASLQDNTLPQKPGELVPGYEGANVSEARLQSHTLSQKAKRELSKKDSAGQFVMNSESDRHHFDINPQKDPLFIASKDAISNPEDYLNVTEEVFDEPTDYVEVKCRKPLEFTFVIDRNYTPEILITTEKIPKIVKAAYWEHGSHAAFLRGQNKIDLMRICLVFWGPWQGMTLDQRKAPVTNLTDHTKSYLYNRWHKGGTRTIINPASQFNVLGPEDIESIQSCRCLGFPNNIAGYEFTMQVFETQEKREIKENWTTHCRGFEDYFESGDYNLIDETIVEGPATRSIEGVNVAADIWKLQQTYLSRGPGTDTCTALLDRGCVQVASTCIEEIQGQCIRVENTFHCPDSVRRLKRSKLTGGNVFCLDGTCTDVSWEDNHDMLEALSKLALLQEMEKTLEDLHVFQGDVKKCSRHCWGFSDCCQLGGGWGESIGFTKCNPDEKLLSKLRGEHKCHYVGSYCSEYVNLGFTKVCIMRKKSYCCFGSILLRLIQEQGRAQLGLGWGSGEHPVCRGLTAEEISRIDFDQLNLEEAFDDIRKSIEIPETSGVVDRFQSNWKKRLPQTQERVLKQQEQGGDSWDLNLEEGESL